MVCLQIISKVLKSKDPTIIINNDLVDKHFIGYEAYYNFIMDHYHKYGNVPDIATFLETFDDFEVLEVAESDEYLVDKVKEEYLYAQLVPILQKTADILTNQTSVEALEYLQSEINNTTPGDSRCGVDIIKNAHLRFEEYEKKRNSEEPWMMSTGFPELDDKIGGLALGEEFVVIVARTNQGKSWILSKIATHIWGLGKNVGYISPEMSASAIGYRFDTLNEHFSNTKLTRAEEIDGYESYINELENLSKTEEGSKFIVRTPAEFNKRITITKLRTFCLQNELDLLCIDGITYLSDERYKKGDNKTTSLTNISEDLMELSVELKIPIVTVVQANRSATGVDMDVPELESIRDSDGIAYNATKVLSIRQNGEYLNIVVKKNRNGPVNVKLAYKWDIDHGLFEYSDKYVEATSGEVRDTNRAFSERNTAPVENKQPLRPIRNGTDIFDI